jgi:hemoglobin-like flavoprotein
MRGVSYNKIGEQEKKVGVIAQEILEVLPEVVSQDETGTYSVAYGNISAVLIEAIKELTNTVKEQQKQIDELKSKLK